MSDQKQQQPISLQAVYLAESHCKLAAGFDPLEWAELASFFRTRDVGEVTVTPLTIHQDDGTEVPGHRCCFRTEFNFVYARKGENPTDPETGDLTNAVAEITARIAVAYLATGPVLPERETLNAWANTSVLIHAWPYWREFCHNSQMRMNLPVTMIPLVSVQQRPTE